MALNEEVKPACKSWVSLYYGRYFSYGLYHTEYVSLNFYSFSAVCTDTISCLSSTSEWIRALDSLLAGRAWEK